MFVLTICIHLFFSPVLQLPCVSTDQVVGSSGIDIFFEEYIIHLLFTVQLHPVIHASKWSEHEEDEIHETGVIFYTPNEIDPLFEIRI